MNSICARINFVLWPAVLLSVVPFYFGDYGYAAFSFLITGAGRVLEAEMAKEAKE